MSPRPGRLAILNRNRAKHHGITVPSTNFFERLNPWYAKIRQWADSLPAAVMPGAINCGPARARQTRQIAARLCQRTTLVLFYEAFMLAPTKT
jgi:hypothetical protein